jgi:hypothetical protein
MANKFRKNHADMTMFNTSDVRNVPENGCAVMLALKTESCGSLNLQLPVEMTFISSDAGPVSKTELPEIIIRCRR